MPTQASDFVRALDDGEFRGAGTGTGCVHERLRRLRGLRHVREADVFLLLNLASPGSFGGTISITGGLLHRSRAPEREEDSILRLAIAVEALGCKFTAPPRLFELREEIASGRTRTIHPMHDDVLDPPWKTSPANGSTSRTRRCNWCSRR